MTVDGKYRSRDISGQCVALSIAHEHHNLLARGLGIDHLRELLIRLARSILRQGASLAYAGHWKETEDNFTFDLLRLISAEQEDNSIGGPDTSLMIGRLYNYLAWPAYEQVTPAIEARWINFCTILRVDQDVAGITVDERATEEDVARGTPRCRINAALTLSAARRMMMTGATVDFPDVGHAEMVPAAIARVMLGGKLSGYSGFVPGIFEEALTALEEGRSAYLLGGFGGASQVLAAAILAGGDQRPPELTPEWHRARDPRLAEMLDAGYALPPGARATEAILDALFDRVLAARADLSTLQTGLSPDEDRTLLATSDVATVVRLVRWGLRRHYNLRFLAA